MASHLRLIAVSTLLAVVLAACGGSPVFDEEATDDPVADGDTTEAETGDGADGGADASDDAAGVEVSGDLGSPPEIVVPFGDPPAGLRVVDLVEGDGAAVEPGAEVTIHYTGVSWLNEGAQFDSSWASGAPVTFPLGNLIPGWQEGIPGMQPGGRRMLIIPPELAYGDQSPTPAIAANDTLVFVIDLIE